MPVRYEFDGRVLKLIPEGNYPPEALFSAWEAAFADARCPADPLLLLDVRASQSVLTRSVAELRQITQFFLAHTQAEAKRVALLAAGPIQFGIMRMAATWVSLDTGKARVFLRHDHALEWLTAVSPSQASDR